MKEHAKRCEKNMLYGSIFTLILGIVLTYNPETSINVISLIISVLFMLLGISQVVEYIRLSKVEKMVSYSLIIGVLLLSVGLYLLFRIKSLINLITTLLGIVMIIKSLFKIQFSFNIKGMSDKWKYNLIIGLVILAIGIILLVNPFESFKIFLRVIGIIISISSIFEIVESINVIKSLDDYKELPFVDKKKKEDE